MIKKFMRKGGQGRAAALHARAVDILNVNRLLPAKMFRRLTLRSATALVAARPMPPSFALSCGKLIS
jgi:hypothetical protein